MTDTPKDALPESMDIEVLPAASSVIEQLTRGEIDVQISTAKRFPRSIVTFRKKALAMATLDEETAGACFYVVPRDGKNIEGPSARLAEIVASAWGHMRIEARVVGEDDRFVTARGTAWDLENNVAIAFETRRRITTRAGKRYSDDMIATTANAAASIALRNAVFKVVPSAFTREIYHQCREVAVGTVETLADRRVKTLAYFQKLGVTDLRVFGLLGVAGVEDITLDHLATLKGLSTAIKEGDVNVDEAFSTTAGSTDSSRALFETIPEALQGPIERMFTLLGISNGQRLVKLNEYLGGGVTPEDGAQKLLDWGRDEFGKRKGSPRKKKEEGNAKTKKEDRPVDSGTQPSHAAGGPQGNGGVDLVDAQPRPAERSDAPSGAVPVPPVAQAPVDEWNF